MKNPWLDIASYKTEDAYRFKGRSDDTKKFLKIVLNGCMTVLYANSGIGKTSFINASIIPELRKEGYLPIRIVFPTEVLGTSDINTWLYSAVKSFGMDSEKIGDRYRWSPTVSEPIKALDNNLWWLLNAHKIEDKATGETYKPLIIFDQFEEIFTKAGNAGNSNSETQNDFFGQISVVSSKAIPDDIERILEQDAPDIELDECQPFKIIFSLRKEYLSDFDYWTNDRYSITELHQNRMFLLPMTRAQAEEVINQQPIDEANPDDYCQTLCTVSDLILDRIDQRRKNAVEPIMLSLLCAKLYELADRNGKESLMPEDIDKYDINTIIYNFYAEKISAIIPNRRHRAEFETVMLDKSGHRNRTKSSLILDGKFDELYKDKLEDAHIIRTEKYEDEDYVELIHDMLAKAVFDARERKKEKKARLRRNVIYILLAMIACAVALDLYHLLSPKPVQETMVTKTVEGTQISFVIVEDSMSVTEDDIWSINVNLKWKSDTIDQDTLIVRDKQTMHDPIGPIFANLDSPLTVKVQFNDNEDQEYDEAANHITRYDSINLAELKYKIPINIKREIVPLKGRAVMVNGRDSIPIRGESVFLYNISAKTDVKGEFSLLIPKNDTVRTAPLIIREGLKKTNVIRGRDGYDFVYIFELDNDTTSFFNACDSILANSREGGHRYSFTYKSPDKKDIRVYYNRLDNDDRVLCYFYLQDKGKNASRLTYFLGEGQIDRAYDRQGLKNFTLVGKDCAGNKATLRATVKNGYMYINLYYSDKEKYFIEKIVGRK